MILKIEGPIETFAKVSIGPSIFSIIFSLSFFVVINLV